MPSALISGAPARSTPPAGSHQALDALLETLEQRGLAPLELRVLLRLSERQATPLDLVEAVGARPEVIRRTIRRLSMRGLIRQRFEGGSRFQFVLSITAAGSLVVEAFTEALDLAGHPQAAPARSDSGFDGMSPKRPLRRSRWRQKRTPQPVTSRRRDPR